MRFDVNDPDIIPLHIFQQKITASLYNNIRLGLLRVANPLTLTLDKQSHIKCYLSNEQWIIVDLLLDEFPLIVWRDFELKNRGLHEPVH